MKDGEQDVEKLFRSGLGKLGFSLDEQAIARLLVYMQELQKWNRRINLIARSTSVVDVVEKHFLDSLTLLPFFSPDGSKRGILLDVGTGAGFPGLVLAAALPELEVILVEPRAKRVSFLRHIIRTLPLANVEVLAERLEDISKSNPEKITYITSRAVAEPKVFLPMVADYLDQGAGVLLMPGRDADNSWQDKGSEPEVVLGKKKQYILPFSGAERTVCLVRKK